MKIVQFRLKKLWKQFISGICKTTTQTMNNTKVLIVYIIADKEYQIKVLQMLTQTFDLNFGSGDNNIGFLAYSIAQKI